jgi:hypothetical protein
MRHLYSFSDFLNEGKIEDIQSKYYSDMETTTFHQIITADPTSITRNGETKKMGTYSKWLLKLFQDGKLLLEDLYKATEYLTMFDKLKAQKVVTGAEADINRYSSLPDLFKYIKLIGGTGEASEDESYLLNDRYFINSGEAVVFHEDERYLIVIPRTFNASQFYAHGTEWCTKYPKMFKGYSERGDLYIIIDKRKLNTDDVLRRMQFHFQSDQYMDILDTNLPQQDKVVFLSIFQQVKVSWKLCYDEVGDYHEGRFPVKLNGKWGVADSDGNVVVSPKYDFVGPHQEGIAGIKLNRKYGFIDLNGKVVASPRYEFVWNCYEGRASVLLNGKYGFIDREGNEVVPLKYDWAGTYQEGRARVELNGKHGFVDMEGSEVIPLIYDSIGDYQEGRVMVKLNGKCGFINLNGDEVVPLKYDRVRDFSEGRASIMLNGKWGFIDLNGNEVVPLIYNHVWNYNEGRAGIELKGKGGYIDLDGNETWD